jgi:hypothetical protein
MRNSSSCVLEFFYMHQQRAFLLLIKALSVFKNWFLETSQYSQGTALFTSNISNTLFICNALFFTLKEPPALITRSVSHCIFNTTMYPLI